MIFNHIAELCLEHWINLMSVAFLILESMLLGNFFDILFMQSSLYMVLYGDHMFCYPIVEVRLLGIFLVIFFSNHVD